MSIHKLTAGSGYDYLTRQVAAHDATERGHTGLASYYTERGECPGVWVGAGIADIEGLDAGEEVSAEQMQALFGSGHHPLAAQRRADLGPDASPEQLRQAGRLGQPYKVYPGDASGFRVEVARRLSAWNQAAGLPRDWPVPVDDRARIRTEVAVEFFRAEHGRDPQGPREIAATIAKLTRPRTTAVAGFDLTFSPVKSISAVWALADPATAARIEQAHQGAVRDALAWIERHALFTRLGTNGVRQVQVSGLVAAAFTHRDSRAGDPDLHTHVAVANKVRTVPGADLEQRWLSIDARMLYRATVGASEVYNTALEQRLSAGLGLVFTEREQPDRSRRPVREVVGVPADLLQQWSARRVSIQARRSELAVTFQARHGRPPTPIESIRLAQQATLETRQDKHEPRTLAEQRTAWVAQAERVLGGRGGVRAMLAATIPHRPRPPGHATSRQAAQWIEQAADRVVAAVQARQATWQAPHVRAEAWRQIRGTAIPREHAEQVVEQVVDAALTGRSVPVTPPVDDLPDPGELRRRDGASMYTVHEAARYTSTAILAAEARIVAAGARTDGPTATDTDVDVALLESAANGVDLNPGQAALVRAMATNPARLQLAIAPAGSGKTTAMHALARAWTESGGHVIGLAPSAAAAAALRDQLGAATDTLAKLTHAIGAGALPDWADQVGPTTLVVLDEAGMADTLSLDAVTTWVLGRGGSVRLIGDDRQLAAIGAGGVLRDIEATHGALRLTELLRFTEVAEAAASLALRDGGPEALGYYLDHHRVHVAGLATMTEDAFTAWQLDRDMGLDALMLAPTRDLAAELNQRARAHRLAGTGQDGPAAALADGAHAGVGDVVITRANDRRLRLSATDWVKNGDRWQVSAVHVDGSLSVHHTRHHLRVHLPAGYVAASVDLGYATTIHTAQGVTADTMHGLLTGTESRQQLYTMLTRGRSANHLYLEVVGDGDPHTVIRPETIHPPTATDILTAVLARDDSPTSATTLHRTATEPATRLGPATDRYSDALTVAAERLAGAAAVTTLTRHVETALPGLSDEPAWPALRGHLLLLAVDGTDPLPRLIQAAADRDLEDAADRAAVLHWRLTTGAAPGPLPWLPAIPRALAQHPTWGPYLNARAALVGDLADQVTQSAPTHHEPVWTRYLATDPGSALHRDIAVWRAATSVPDSDPRPLGPHRGIGAAADWQTHLRRRLTTGHGDALAEWKPLLTGLHPPLARDDYTPQLAHHLAALSRAGLGAVDVTREALADGPLPDDHAAGALWWRITARLGPAAGTDTTHTASAGVDPSWWPDLATVLGEHRATTLTASPWWPALATGIGHALARGWTLPDLIGPTTDTTDPDPGLDLAQALAWRTSVLIDPPTDPDHEPDPAPDDLWAEIPDPHNPDDALHQWSPDLTAVDDSTPEQDPAGDQGVDNNAPDVVEADLLLFARIRAADRPLGPADADIEAQIRRANAWDGDIPLDRLRAVIAAAHDYYQANLPGSWAHQHLLERFGHDLTGHPHYAPGHAPAGWTTLCEHLAARGVTPDELLSSGLATRSRRGSLIDRFRDRVVFPITDHRTGHVIAFTARHHPHLDANQDSPKYLNTPETVLFHKGSHLFGYIPELLDAGAIPVRVEGSTDAIAVTLATGGRYLGLAPLGTSLTSEQATLLAHTPRARDLVIATDADTAGRLAAERDYWLLTPHGLDPHLAPLPEGSDPADLLARRGPLALSATLAGARPLGDVLLDERLTNLTGQQALTDAVTVLTARPPAAWDTGTQLIATHLDHDEHDVRRALRDNLRTWIEDPRAAAAMPIAYLRDVRARLQPAVAAQPDPATQTPAHPGPNSSAPNPTVLQSAPRR